MELKKIDFFKIIFKWRQGINKFNKQSIWAHSSAKAMARNDRYALPN